MKTVSFYDPETGLFAGRWFSGPGNKVERNTPQGMAAIEGRYDPKSQRVDIETGEVVPYEPPATPLEDVKQARWAELKRARDAAEYGGFFIPGLGAFQSDPASQRLITGSVVLAQLAVAQGAPFSVTWTLADNSIADLDAEAMIAVGVALGMHVEACHVAGRVARSALEAASTAEEVAAVEFTL